MNLNEMAIGLFSEIKGWVEPALQRLQSENKAANDAMSGRLEELQKRLDLSERKNDELQAAYQDWFTEVKEWMDFRSKRFEELVSKSELEALRNEPLVLEGEALDAVISLVKEGLPEPQQGPQGEKGEPGQPVELDVVRAMVEEAVMALPKAQDGKDGKDGQDGNDGRDGKDGRDGSDGKDGSDGRDALDLEILPEINFERSYPFGTFALHEGGLWRANQRTTGKHGWECIVAGMIELDFSLENERDLVVSGRISGGDTKQKRFSVPTMIYRGVWRDGQGYTRGDTVTRAGSVWHCEVEAPTTAPGSVNDQSKKEWTLCVKKGASARAAG